MHILCRNHTYQLARTTQSKGQVQGPSIFRMAQGMKPRLALAVRGIIQQWQRGIEKNLLRLCHAAPMLIVLALVACIPLKANDGHKIDHFLYIAIMYKWVLL